ENRAEPDGAENPPEASPPTTAAAAVDVLHAAVRLRGRPTTGAPGALRDDGGQPPAALPHCLRSASCDTRTHVRVGALVESAAEAVGAAVAELDAPGVGSGRLVHSDHAGERRARLTAVEPEHTEVPADLEPTAAVE